MIPATEILITVFISSLLGSFHCVGMCGGLLSICCINTKGDKPNRNIIPELSYHVMRLVSYIILGSLAGLIGSFAAKISNFTGFQHGFGILAGLILILWGVRDLNLFKINNWKLFRSSGLQSALSISIISHKIFQYPLKQTGALRGAFIGLMSGLLPCGWLYAYVLTASTTQNPIGGMIIMIFFWAGTVPILFVFARLIKKLDSRLLSKTPKITACLVIILGIMSISGKMQIIEVNSEEESSSSQAYCH